MASFKPGCSCSFSVVTPSLRSSRWLRLCISSVADQQVDLQHIVQDGLSDDGTLDWLASDRRVELHVQRDNGMYDAVNRGLLQAKGDILAHLNCDEQYLPGALQRVGTFFQLHPKIDVVFGDAIVVDESGNYICHRRSLLPNRIHGLVTDTQSVLTCATFFRRALVERAGMLFDPNLRVLADRLWVSRLVAADVPMAMLGEVTSTFTLGRDNLGTRPLALQEAARLAHYAPRVARLAQPLVNLHHRLRRLHAGHYFEHRPSTYAIYTQQSPAARAVFKVQRPKFRWPRPAQHRVDDKAAFEATIPQRRTPPRAAARPVAKQLLRGAIAQALLRAPSLAVRPHLRRKRELVLYKCDALGDFILALGALRYAMSRVAPERTTLVVSELTGAYARAVFPDVHVVTLPWPNARLSQAMRAAPGCSRALDELDTETCLVLRHQQSTFDEIALRRIAAHRTVGCVDAPYSPASDLPRRAVTHAVRYPSSLLRKGGLNLELIAHARVLGRWLGHPVDARCVLPSLTSPSTSPGEGPVLVAPLAGSRDRDLDPEWVADVLAIGMAGKLRPVRFSGTVAQRSRLFAYIERAQSRGLVNVALDQAVTFFEFQQHVAHASAVLSTDTSTAHLATALDRPLVALLGGGHFGHFGPWSRSHRQRWLYQPMACYGCAWDCRFDKTRCVQEIQREHAGAALAALLTDVTPLHAAMAQNFDYQPG